jgi:hypothetical protein
VARRAIGTIPGGLACLYNKWPVVLKIINILLFLVDSKNNENKYIA